jgi:DNA-directed RNA polymerase specialized sigma24 family protein
MAVTDSLLLFRRERPAPDVPDEHLVSLCSAGNAAALDLLFRRHGDRVYRFLGRLPAVRRGDLEDLARATFIEAYRAAGEYAERTSVSVWIIGIAVAVLRRYLDGASRCEPVGAEAQVAALLPADGAARRSGALARVAREMGELPGDLQLAFVLCDLEEIRGADVARMLGVSRKLLWAQVHEARCRIAAALGSDPGAASQVAP